MIDRSFRALTLGLLATTALASPAFAQAPARRCDARDADTQSPAPGTNATDVTSPPEPVKQAQAAQGVPDQTEIIITATKREENLQNVPISVQAIGTRRLDQLNISNFEEYTKQLPSVSFQTAAPGFTDGLHARRRDRRRRQPHRLAAVGRHLPRRAAGHDDRRNARRPHLRHRPHREPRGAAGHALRCIERSGHDPHHHQQARARRHDRPRGRASSTPSLTAGRAASSKA